MNKFAFTLAAAMGVATAVSADTWDMPTPYGDATFHTVNIREFAADVAEATDGALEIEVHSAGSLFPHGEIKNAVRSGQVPLGEFFLSTLANEDLAFGMDSQPFLATSYEEAEKLWAAQKPVIAELLGEQGLTMARLPRWTICRGCGSAPTTLRSNNLPPLPKPRRYRLKPPIFRRPSPPVRSKR